MAERSTLQPVMWVGASHRDFCRFPDEVQARMGYALYVAQLGDKHRDAKPLRGFGGAGVLEIVSDHQGDTFRCVYTARIAGSVYVPHAFQKKSKSGRETPKAEIDLIKRRLRDAEKHARGSRT
jgi:phage-related protein